MYSSSSIRNNNKYKKSYLNFLFRERAIFSYKILKINKSILKFKKIAKSTKKCPICLEKFKKN